MEKIRLDIFLVSEGYFQTRQKAKMAICEKKVLVDGKLPTKAGMLITEDVSIKLSETICPYVSRGGLKLLEAIKKFNLNLADKTMLDVGASTGGFCDCALEHGVSKIAALDVGTNQLVDKIRNNSKVEVFEQINFRSINESFFKEKFDIITMDVSFISANLLTKNVELFLKDDGIFICLIKPQFEAGPDVERNKKGVILETSCYKDVISNFIKKCEYDGLYVNKVIDSPIKGGSGNQEFLALITKNDTNIFSNKEIELLLNLNKNSR